MTTVTGALLGPLLAADPHRPRIVSYGGGGRAELSTASLGNWAAKVAGLLRDELGGSAGDLVFVATPPGWQTAAVLLGAWWAGLAVTDQDDPSALAAFLPDPGSVPGADPSRVPAGAGPGRADDVFVVSGHPLGAPSRGIQPHQTDFTGAVLPQADRFAAAPLDGDAPALAGSRELTVTEALGVARSAATALGVSPRVLSASAWAPLPLAVALLGGALLAGGSLIQLLPGSPEAEQAGSIASTERADVTAGDPPQLVAGLRSVTLRGMLG